MLPPRYVEIQRTRGTRLDTINPGSEEVALRRADALEAIRALEGSLIAILGGDVLKLTAGKLHYAHANWFCKKNPGEDDSSYASRSRDAALIYIERFMPLGAFEPLFVLVLSPKM